MFASTLGLLAFESILALALYDMYAIDGGAAMVVWANPHPNPSPFILALLLPLPLPRILALTRSRTLTRCGRRSRSARPSADSS